MIISMINWNYLIQILGLQFSFLIFDNKGRVDGNYICFSGKKSFILSCFRNVAGINRKIRNSSNEKLEIPLRIFEPIETTLSRIVCQIDLSNSFKISISQRRSIYRTKMILTFNAWYHTVHWVLEIQDTWHPFSISYFPVSDDKNKSNENLRWYQSGVKFLKKKKKENGQISKIAGSIIATRLKN